MKKMSLLALAVLLLTACGKEKSVRLTVVNDSTLDRQQETVEFCMRKIAPVLGIEREAPVVVYDAQGQEIPSQMLKNACAYGRLIFQVSLKAGDSAVFTVKPGIPSQYPVQAQATFMPRRKDDISWENDRTIFRMYGPALATDPDEALISGGLDLWVKRVPALVSQRWYQDEFDGKAVYHKDNGEGLDFYSVGRSLGAGGMAPFINGKLCLVGNNFQRYEILENGPIRTAFRLEYDAYDVNGRQVSEQRIVSLDAGSMFNRFTITYDGLEEGTALAAGFPFRGFPATAAKLKGQPSLDVFGDVKMNPQAGYVTYAEPENQENGIIYLGSIMGVPSTIMLADGHILNCIRYAGKPVTYYSGGGWNKGGFATLDDWTACVADFAARLQSPLKTSVKDCCEADHCK
ncbi:MAG: DUF4861 family protein [Bacteroidales bacterium]|nr:DUF4861 family protein [Bacteroidales bacterium]